MKADRPRLGSPGRRRRTSSTAFEARLDQAFGTPSAGKASSPPGGVAGGSRPRVGRPSLLTPDAHAQIVRAVLAGNPLKHVVEAYGVAYSTSLRWLADGRAHAAGLPTTAQREALGSEAEAQAELPCSGLDAIGADGHMHRVCRSGLHPVREFWESVDRARRVARLNRYPGARARLK